MMKLEGTIALVDDNQGVLDSLELYLKSKFSRIFTFRSPDHLMACLKSEEVDMVLLDMNFKAGITNGNEGLFWLREIKNLSPQTHVIMITAYGEIELAVKAMKRGATDFIVKPWDNKKLFATLETILKLRKTEEKLKASEEKQQLLQVEIDRKKSVIIGNSAIMKEVIRVIEKVASTDANILITGENGTGKELVAREIHRQSARRNQVFLTIDMGTITDTIFESEMFGHVKGAFTGAAEARTGRLRAATNGTLFLDEIGNLPLSSQSKLLSALEQRKIQPVGGTNVYSIDIRLISATNNNLEEMVRQGLFREDLLYRLKTIQIEVPPLRERLEDIPLLVDYYISYFASHYRKGLLDTTPETINKLQMYKWPGNIRELKHSIEKAVILAEGKVLKPRDFPLNNHQNELSSSLPTGISMEETEKMLIAKNLEENKWNISATADCLKITRQTLYRKIKKYGLQ